MNGVSFEIIRARDTPFFGGVFLVIQGDQKMAQTGVVVGKARMGIIVGASAGCFLLNTPD